MSLQSLRIRYVVAVYGRPLAAALVVVALVATGLTVSALAAGPQTEQVTRQANRVAVESTLATSAVVTGDSTLYDRGRVLHNRAIYFTNPSPQLTLTLRTTVDGAARTAVRHRIAVVVVGTISGNSFYREVHALANGTASTAGEPVVTNATLSIPEFRREHLQPVRQEIGGAGSLEVQVRARTTYDTRTYQDALTVSKPLAIESRSYSLEAPASATNEHSNPVTRQVTRPPDPTPPTSVRAAVAMAALLGAVGVVRARRNSLPPERLERAMEREQYAEWISTGAIPADDAARAVRLDSLEDVVETGIDAGRRVIHDESTDTFAVFDGETIYHWSDGPGDGEAGRTLSTGVGIGDGDETDRGVEADDRDADGQPTDGDGRDRGE